MNVRETHIGVALLFAATMAAVPHSAQALVLKANVSTPYQVGIRQRGSRR
jgi:hypothetical protein